MNKDEEIAELWDLAITKAKGWQHHNCPIVRGDFGDLERAWNTITAGKTEAQRTEMLQAIKLAVPEQAKARKLDRQSNEKPPQPKLIGAYLRAKRWMDDIGSIQERQKKQPDRQCQCGRVVIGPKFDQCDYCYSIENGNTVEVMRLKCKELQAQHWTPQQHLDYIRKQGIKI